VLHEIFDNVLFTKPVTTCDGVLKVFVIRVFLFNDSRCPPFRRTPQGQTEALARYGVLGVEMEAAALYGVAAEYDKQALAILTVSDRLLDHSSDMSATERETRFTDSLRLAVAAAHS